MKPAWKRLSEMSSADLKTVWESLKVLCWTEDDYNGDVSMTEWAKLVYSEMSMRGIPRD